MFDNSNQYNVRWNLRVDTKLAYKNLAEYTAAVNRATQASLQLKKVSRQMLNTPAVGGGVASGSKSGGGGGVIVSGQKSTQASRSYVGGNQQSRSSQPSKATGTSQKTSAPKGGGRGRTFVANPTGRGSGKGFQNPLRNTPFVGLMGTMLAYSAISSEVSQAAEYANIMTTAKAILKTADSDLGTFEARFANLAKNVRQIGVETKFTAKEVADATRYLAMAGLDTNAINSAMRPITNLALIADEDLGLIADLTTNIMTGYGIDAQSMSPVADVLTSVMTRSNVSITEIAESYKMSAGFLRSAGVDFNEAAAAIGVLGDAGIKATMAGTALRAMSVRFAKPTKEAIAVLDKLGVSFTEVTDVAGESVVKVRPLFEIFGDLKKSGATLEDMQKVFGTIGGNAAVNLIENADKIERLRRATLVSHGATDFISKEKLNTVSNKWYQMTSAFSEQFTRSFETLEPQIVKVLSDITKRIASSDFGKGLHELTGTMVQLFSVIMEGVTWIMKNMDWIKPLLLAKFIGKNTSGLLNSLVGAVSAIGGSLGAGAAVNMTKMFGSLKVFLASNPIGIIAAVLGVLGTVEMQSRQFFNANNAAFQAIEDGSPIVARSYDKITASINRAIKAAYDLKGLQPNDDSKAKASEVTGIESDTTGWFTKATSFGNDLLNPFNYIQLAASGISALIPKHKGWKVWQSNPYMFKPDATFNANARWQQATGLGIKDSEQIAGQAMQKLGFIDDAESARKLESDLTQQLKSGDVPKDMYGTDLGKGHRFIKKGDGTVEYLKKSAEYMESYNENLQAIIKNVGMFGDFMESNKPSELLLQAIPDVQRLYDELVLDEKTGKYVLPPLKKDATDKDVKAYNNRLSFINSMFRPLATKDGGLGAVFGEEGAYNVLSRVFGDDVMSVTPTSNLSNMSVRDLSGAGLGDFYGDGSSGRGGIGGGLSRSNATPRQVIINIDNMLNMESVSVNENNKGEVFDNFKQELTEALLDVVSDTSASFHG